MTASTWLLRSLLAGLLVGLAVSQELTFRYDPRHAAGVSGAIRARYEPTRRHPDRAIVSVDLDFSKVSQRALTRLRCEGPVREYEWHLHTKWTAPHSSGSLEECSPRQAGNHYDPDFACGPSSEFADSPACRHRRGHYNCMPVRYREDRRVCEQGDFSGKFGNLKADEDGRVRGRWEDPFFPAFANATADWNVILHPVCPERETPRLACAVVRIRDDSQT